MPKIFLPNIKNKAVHIAWRVALAISGVIPMNRMFIWFEGVMDAYSKDEEFRKLADQKVEEYKKEHYPETT